jgi:hypothetical protein
MDDKEAQDARRKQTLFDAALTLLLERAGGSLTFSEADYQAVVRKYGGASMMAIHYEVLDAQGDVPHQIKLVLIRKPPGNAELTS